MDETFSTYSDAERGGAVERGWIPKFVPASAQDIKNLYDVDTNRQVLRFRIPSSEVGAMVAGLRRVSVRDQAAAAALSSRYGLDKTSETYMVCSKPLNGALAVDRGSGQVIFDTSVQWVSDDCS